MQSSMEDSRKAATAAALSTSASLSPPVGGSTSPPISPSFDAGGSVPLSYSSGSSSTSPSCNPRRSLNAAFTLSPRTDSVVEASEEYYSNVASVCLELDLLEPPTKKYYNLSSLEERSSFVTTDCIAAAQSMSTQHIINHLLPALLTAFESDDYGESFDDCAPSIARALPPIIASMDARTTANLTYFVGLIMDLCCSAEATVIKETSAALQAVIGMLDDQVISELFLPLVLAMRESFWSAPRTVAASLLSRIAIRPKVLYSGGFTLLDIFNFFVESSRDTSSMVRAAVVMSLRDWVQVAMVHQITFVEIPFPLITELATDDLSDTVRYLLIEEIVQLASLVGSKVTSKYLLPTFLSACNDPSWRVRYMAANHLGTMAGLVLNADDLKVALKMLSTDEEPETRAAVARQLVCLVEHCSSDVIERYCVPVALNLSQDYDPVVRHNAARNYHAFIMLGNDSTVAAICKAALYLMQDTSFVVQESAIEGLESVVEGLVTTLLAAEHQFGSPTLTPTSGTEEEALVNPTSPFSTSHSSHFHHSHHHGSRHAASSSLSHHASSLLQVKEHIDAVITPFIEHLQDLSDSRNWRIRNAVVAVVPCFARLLKPERFHVLADMVFVSLHDPVSKVRMQAVKAIEAVAEVYGAEWAALTTTALLHAEAQSSAATISQGSYVQRAMVVRCLEVLLPLVARLSALDLRRQQLLVITSELIREYSRDRVPNVRLAVANALPQWVKWFSTAGQERIIYNDCIAALQADADTDVRNVAKSIPCIPSSPPPAEMA